MAFLNSSAPFFAVLLCDILNTILRNGINVKGPSRGRSIAAVVLLCLMTVFTAVVFFIVNIGKSDNKIACDWKDYFEDKCSPCLNPLKALWSRCLRCFERMCYCNSSYCSNNNETTQQYDQLDTQRTSSSIQGYQSIEHQDTSEPTNKETIGQTNKQSNKKEKTKYTKEEKKELVFEIVIILFSVLSVLCYFVGDNLTPLMQIYGTDIGCSGKCIRNIRIASVVLLAFSLFLRSSLFCQPIKIFMKPKAKEEKIPGKTIAKSFVFMYKMDTINTALALAVETSEFCDPTDLIITGSLVALCISVGIVSIWLKGILAFKKPQNISDTDNKENAKSKEEQKCKKKVIVSMCIFLSIAFALYLLFDNEMPMDCAFKCDRSTANDNCKVGANYGTRMAAMIIVTVSVIVAAILNWYYVERLSQKAIDFGEKN